MKIEDAPFGSRVQYKSVKVWNLGKTPNGHLSGHCLVGFKIGEDDFHGQYGWPTSELISENEKPARKLLKNAGCDRGWWIEKDEEILIIAAINHSPSPPSGMACRLCKDYAEYAIPNRPDGKHFICYSCLRGWVPAGF